MYMETCESRSDDIGIGKACEAIAKAYDRLVTSSLYCSLTCKL